MRPSLDDLKHLWLIAYSRSGLLEAQRWIDQMSMVDSNSPLMSALLSAVVTAYGRGFTQSRVSAGVTVIPLAQAPSPPTGLQETHEELLKMRNRVIGHKDALPAEGTQAHRTFSISIAIARASISIR